MMIVRKISQALATGFGIGYIPWASATWASMATLGAMYFAWPETHRDQAIVCGGLAVLAWLATTLALPLFRVKDPRPVVIDEVLGCALTMAFHPARWEYLIIAFALFRFFDILKPFPIRQSEKLPGALGVVVDDALAGVAANLCLTAVIRLIPL